MFKKSCSLLSIKFLFENGQHFLDIQYILKEDKIELYWVGPGSGQPQPGSAPLCTVQIKVVLLYLCISERIEYILIYRRLIQFHEQSLILILLQIQQIFMYLLSISVYTACQTGGGATAQNLETFPDIIMFGFQIFFGPV